MRDRIIDPLGDLTRPRFLVHLMGPYKAFDVGAVHDSTDVDGAHDPARIPAGVDFGSPVGSDVDLDQQEAVLDLLLSFAIGFDSSPG